jgi:hypothetical protein
MSYTERFSETHVPLIIGTHNTLAPGTYDTEYVSLMNYHRAFLMVQPIEMGAGASLTVSVRQATDTAGTSVKAITGKSMTALTAASGDEGVLNGLELRTEELDVSSLFDCVCVRLVVAGAACIVAYYLLGIVTRFAPVSTAAWNEIVT